MTHIRGITVILTNFVESGVNPIGEPEFDEVSTTVDNVLISPSTQEDIVNNLELYGKRAEYTLAIPKGDENDWQDAEVYFFGQKYRTFGAVQQGLDHLIPLSWNKKVQVERFE